MRPFNDDSYLHAEIGRLMGRWDVDVAFETGTFQGHSTVALSLMCETTYTVEIVEENRDQACDVFASIQELGSIISLLGSSPEMISEVSRELEGKRVLYFLDAHWESYWPILDELAVIAKIKGPKPIVVIHDFLVPNRPDLGYDSYRGQPLDLDFVMAGLRGIYGPNFECYYNRLATGAQRGVLFVEPHDDSKKPLAPLLNRASSKPDSSAGKVIVWTPTNAYCGFCDRLRGIAAGAVFAEAMGARLLVNWIHCEPCPVEYRDVFLESEYFSTEWEAEDLEVLEHWDHEIAVMPLDLCQKFRDGLFGGDLEIELSDEFVLKRWGEILRSLQPLPAIARKIEVLYRRCEPSRMLGIHLRRTDVLDDPHKEITKTNVAEYDATLWSRLTEAVEMGGTDFIYLACDDKAYFERWKEKLGELPVEVIYHEQTWGTGLRQTPVEGLVIDLYMLIQCREVYGSVWSSIFFIGEAMGGKFEIVSPPQSDV